MSTKIERAKEIRKKLENNAIDKVAALDLLKELINSKDICISELDIYLNEIDNIKKIKLIKSRINNKIDELEDNSNQIIDFLNLSNDEFKRLKNFGYKLL
ncbi:hypothetical protein NACSLCCMFF_190033 [Tenacibaculum maritimum]|uniref:hypothetical protein n=1 Tax=Tenacibaculum maritimum TaxID=107401 RepID=UPI0012E5D805|nr:hypothetical protein [Tenacibaculum maritimum]CAA0176498.1 hypothetical protein NACSLCCMFF_190033 [Tenacibaculum maritimum]